MNCIQLVKFAVSRMWLSGIVVAYWSLTLVVPRSTPFTVMANILSVNLEKTQLHFTELDGEYSVLVS